MLKNEHKQLSLYSILYNKIPQNHILKIINHAVNFSFINSLLKGSYSKYYGRPAKEPEMLAKLLVLQYLYNLSDERVIAEAALNLAFMWFIGINPDEDLPDPSLLAKFRTQRLQETTVDDIIKEVVKQCIDKGIIKDTGMSVDSTPVSANTTKKVPERIMKQLAKQILTNVEKENGSIPQGIDKNIPQYKEIKDHKEAKATLESYLNTLIETVEKTVDPSISPETEQSIEKARQILSDPKFIQQKGIRSLVDKDARVGYKSKTDNFFGYKVEFAMLPKDRIITAVLVEDGSYVDGTNFMDLYQRTKECGIKVKTSYGDKAYFRKHILDMLKEDQVEAIIPVSESVYRLDESKYQYNKDSDQWRCAYGNHSVGKRKVKRKDGREFLEYRFERETCRNCPERKECIKGKTIAKKLSVGLSTAEFYEYSQKAKSPEFLEKYKKRAAHEWKNGEMKRFHGLGRAGGYGLKSMRMQAQLTALAVNLKRIAALVSSLLMRFFNFFNTRKRHYKFDTLSP